MFWTFILGVIAGYAAPFAEDRIKEPLERNLGGGPPIAPNDMRAIALVICLLVAVVVAMILASSHAFPLVLGAFAGVLGPRIVEKFRAMRAPDYDS